MQGYNTVKYQTFAKIEDMNEFIKYTQNIKIISIETIGSEIFFESYRLWYSS